MEHVAEQDDELFEKYLGGEELTVEEIKTCIRKSTIANHMVPVTCGTSYRNKGVQPLLNAIIDYMPAPTDVPDIKGVNPTLGKRRAVLLTITLPSLRWPLRLPPTPLLVSCASSACTPVPWTPVPLSTTP